MDQNVSPRLNNAFDASDEYDDSLLDMIRILWHYKVFVVSVVLVMSLSATAYMLRKPTVYQASTTLHPGHQPSSPSDPKEITMLFDPRGITIDEYYQLACSATFRKHVAEQWTSKGLIDTDSATDKVSVKKKLQDPTEIIIKTKAGSADDAKEILGTWIAEYRKFVRRHLARGLLKSVGEEILKDQTTLDEITKSLEFLKGRQELSGPSGAGTEKQFYFASPVETMLVKKQVDQAEIRQRLRFGKRLMSALQPHAEGKESISSEDPSMVSYADSLVRLKNNLIIDDLVVTQKQPLVLLTTAVVFLLSLAIACMGVFVINNIRQQLSREAQAS